MVRYVAIVAHDAGTIVNEMPQSKQFIKLVKGKFGNFNIAMGFNPICY
jgi:hypothetical protein